MNRRQFVPLLGAALMLSGCGWNDSSWNQKLTVTVDTPDGPKQGSAVTSVAWSYFPAVDNGSGWSSELKGEATVVDLGSGKYLFALLGNDKADGQNMDRMGLFSLDMSTDQGNEFKRHKGPIMIVPRQHPMPVTYPMLVTFDNVNDPKTVKLVNPSDLAASFGAGYSLKSITLEITGEPVTEGNVKELLPTLTEIGRERGSLIPKAQWGSNQSQNEISPGNFSTELYK